MHIYEFKFKFCLFIKINEDIIFQLPRIDIVPFLSSVLVIGALVMESMWFGTESASEAVYSEEISACDDS